jgi:hypothetical protein
MDDSKTQKALTRLFLALRNAPENKLPRTSIYERTLNKELTAAELNGLKSHWLVQRFITIEKVKVVTHGPLAELWTLLKSALDYPEELSFVFGQRPEPVAPAVPEAESKSNDGSAEEEEKPESLLDKVAAHLSGARYTAPPRPIFRDALHKFYERDGLETKIELRDNKLFVDGTERSPILLIPVKPAPNYRLALQGERIVWVLKESIYDEEPSPLYSGAPSRNLSRLPPAEPGEITYLRYSPKENPSGTGSSIRNGKLTGSETGDVPADWQHKINGWG